MGRILHVLVWYFLGMGSALAAGCPPQPDPQDFAGVYACMGNYLAGTGDSARYAKSSCKDLVDLYQSALVKQGGLTKNNAKQYAPSCEIMAHVVSELYSWNVFWAQCTNYTPDPAAGHLAACLTSYLSSGEVSGRPSGCYALRQAYERVLRKASVDNQLPAGYSVPPCRDIAAVFPPPSPTPAEVPVAAAASPASPPDKPATCPDYDPADVEGHLQHCFGADNRDLTLRTCQQVRSAYETRLKANGKLPESYVPLLCSLADTVIADNLAELQELPEKCEMMLKWLGRIDAEYPGVDMKSLPRDQAYSIASNLFRPRYFVDAFGFDYIISSARNLSVFYNSAIRPCEGFISDFTQYEQRFSKYDFLLDPAFGFPDSDFAHDRIVPLVSDREALNAWMDATLARTASLPPDEASFREVGSYIAVAPQKLAPLWPSEVPPFSAALQQRQVEIAQAILGRTKAAINALPTDFAALPGISRMVEESSDYRRAATDIGRVQFDQDVARKVDAILTASLEADFAAIRGLDNSFASVRQSAEWYDGFHSKYSSYQDRPSVAAAEKDFLAWRDRLFSMLKDPFFQTLDNIPEDERAGGEYRSRLAAFMSLPVDRTLPAYSEYMSVIADKVDRIEADIAKRRLEAEKQAEMARLEAERAAEQARLEAEQAAARAKTIKQTLIASLVAAAFAFFLYLLYGRLLRASALFGFKNLRFSREDLEFRMKHFGYLHSLHVPLDVSMDALQAARATIYRYRRWKALPAS